MRSCSSSCRRLVASATPKKGTDQWSAPAWYPAASAAITKRDPAQMPKPTASWCSAGRAQQTGKRACRCWARHAHKSRGAAPAGERRAQLTQPRVPRAHVGLRFQDRRTDLHRRLPRFLRDLLLGLLAAQGLHHALLFGGVPIVGRRRVGDHPQRRAASRARGVVAPAVGWRIAQEAARWQQRRAGGRCLRVPGSHRREGRPFAGDWFALRGLSGGRPAGFATYAQNAAVRCPRAVCGGAEWGH